MYATARWRRLRKAILIRDPLCVICKAMEIYEAAAVVDHIKPLSKGDEPWDPANLRGLCKRCHDEIIAKMTRNISPELAEEERKWRLLIDSPINKPEGQENEKIERG